MTDEAARCILQNQIEIMSGLSLLLRYAKPDLIGKAGELDMQRDDLLQRHKATQRAISTLTPAEGKTPPGHETCSACGRLFKWGGTCTRGGCPCGGDV